MNYLVFLINKKQRPVATLLQQAEQYLTRRHGEAGINQYPPVFIVGAPRCGSTLLYKILTERYEFAFISNFTSQLYLTPAAGTWLQKKLGITAQRGDYAFNYGVVKGLGAPSECGAFWYRWFPSGIHVYIGRNQTSTSVLQELRGSIGAIAFITQSPMIFKNLYNAMRVAPILEAIPEACFIVCKRDYAETALSILKGRITNLNNKTEWWSLPPKEVDHLLGKHYAEQVAGQVYYTYQQIENDMSFFGSERFLEVRYEDFCNDVHGTLNTIESFLADRGCRLNKKWEVPPRFRVSYVKDIETDDRKRVEKAMTRFLTFNGACIYT